MLRCQAVTKRGDQCKRSQVIGSAYCRQHGTAVAEAASPVASPVPAVPGQPTIQEVRDLPVVRDREVQLRTDIEWFQEFIKTYNDLIATCKSRTTKMAKTDIESFVRCIYKYLNSGTPTMLVFLINRLKNLVIEDDDLSRQVLVCRTILERIRSFFDGGGREGSFDIVGATAELSTRLERVVDGLNVELVATRLSQIAIPGKMVKTKTKTAVKL